MTNHIARRALPPIAIAAATLLAAAGCSVGRFDVNVELAEQVRKRSSDVSAEVHIVGLTEQEARVLESLPLRTYWEEDGKRLDDSIRVAIPLRSQSPTFVLNRNDEVWRRWAERGATRLVVIAHYPRPLDQTDPKNDPRHKFVPLKSSFLGLGGPRGIDVEVTELGVVVHETH